MNGIFRKLDRFFQYHWRLAVLDYQRGLWSVSPNHLPYLKAQNANGHHILIQPDHQPFFMLADDLNPVDLKTYHHYPDGTWKPGRMIVLTSPGNYQVWIHTNRDLPVEEKRYWLRHMHSDPGADPHNRWGRCPGFFNRKDKHRSPTGRFPLAKLIWVDWLHVAQIPPMPTPQLPHHTEQADRPLHPSYATNIRRSDYDRYNESATDFALSLALARKGYSKQQIIEQLLHERRDWTHHLGVSRLNDYLERTVSKAIEIVRSTPNKYNSVISK